jgi:hypothetical protein
MVNNSSKDALIDNVCISTSDWNPEHSVEK